ncbi:ROK family protein [Patescibacteria group bacterium]|nr:ROK family protein [Patescibacteria group bacterium]
MSQRIFKILFDIGGTYVRASLVSGQKIIKTIKIKQLANLVDFKKNFSKLFSRLSGDQQISVVDIGVAGRVSGTKVISCSNIPFLKNFNFKTLLPVGVKLIVDNDARWRLRQILKTKPLWQTKKILLITLGTGVGRAVAENGRVKKIKKLEQREPWESEYKIKKSDGLDNFVSWLHPKIADLANKYNPEILILAGGLLKRKKDLLFVLLKKIKKFGSKLVAVYD